MRTIIVPTDFSNNAFHALACACEYFKYERSKFIVVHAFADEVYANESLNDKAELHIFRDQTQSLYDAKLVDLHKKIREHSPNPKHEIVTQATFATLPDAVNELVIKENADLVVMGTQGITADPSITYGTNTLQVIKYVNCPVMGIPMDYEYRKPDHILFPSDLKLSYLGRELKMISCLAQSFRSVLHLLYISDDEELTLRQKEVKDYWEYRFRESEQTFTHLHNSNIFGGINSFIVDHDIDMVVLVNSVHTFMNQLVHSHTIDDIGINTRIPFLILQNLPR